MLPEGFPFHQFNISTQGNDVTCTCPGGFQGSHCERAVTIVFIFKSRSSIRFLKEIFKPYHFAKVIFLKEMLQSYLLFISHSHVLQKLFLLHQLFKCFN